MNPDAQQPLVACEYLRVSYDRSGRMESPDEQHEHHVREAAARGWTLGNSYRDEGSASRFAKKARDDFDRLVTDLRTGRFGAQILILWESSRGSRKVGEWVELIELCEERGVKIYVSTHQRLYAPGNHRDRRSLLEDAVDSEYESAKTSERMQRSHEARAVQGRPVARLSYGYRRSYDATTGKLLGRVPEPSEAKNVVELFGRFVSGESIRAIQKDWAGRGILNRSGRPFTGAHLRDVLRNRAYIAERVHVPGKETRWWRARDEVRITPGIWPPIVEREVFFQVQAILDDPSRVATRPGGAKHLLSMIARCDKCEGPVAVITFRAEQVYRCRDGGCVMVLKSDLDAYMLERIFAYLARDDIYASLTHGDEREHCELQEARAELAEIEQHYRDLKTSFKRRRISVAAFEEAEPAVLGDLDVARARVQQLETPPVLRGFLRPGEDVAERWEHTPMAARRKIVQWVLSPERAGQLRIVPSPSRGHRVPIKDRVVLHRVEHAGVGEG